MMEEALDAYLPDGWSIANIINLRPGWQANICDGTNIVIGSGETIDEAIANACDRTIDEACHRRLFSIPLPPPKPGLAARLGFSAPQPRITRR